MKVEEAKKFLDGNGFGITETDRKWLIKENPAMVWDLANIEKIYAVRPIKAVEPSPSCWVSNWGLFMNIRSMLKMLKDTGDTVLQW